MYAFNLIYYVQLNNEAFLGDKYHWQDLGHWLCESLKKKSPVPNQNNINDNVSEFHKITMDFIGFVFWYGLKINKADWLLDGNCNCIKWEVNLYSVGLIWSRFSI